MRNRIDRRRGQEGKPQPCHISLSASERERAIASPPIRPSISVLPTAAPSISLLLSAKTESIDRCWARRFVCIIYSVIFFLFIYKRARPVVHAGRVGRHRHKASSSRYSLFFLVVFFFFFYFRKKKIAPSPFAADRPILSSADRWRRSRPAEPQTTADTGKEHHAPT